ncbi:hypothetical protein C8J57DRAFT_1627387 [Mycena rebaudengoi]|nr:hypothetical protein C8J57DRAFT_1627387 [Mycena rebaudengoi]
MEHPANSYRDLDFLLDPMQLPINVKKALVYSDDIKDCGKIIDCLNSRVHPDYRSRGIVRPYNAGMSRKYRTEVMALFRAGIVRILVCTDAAGMTLSSWVQRAGRAACAAGAQGLAVMLVEKSAFEVDSSSSPDSSAPTTPEMGSRGRGRGRGCGRGRGHGGTGRGGRKQGKDYAESHGQKRGSFRGTDDAVLPRLDTPDIAGDTPAEGLYALIQATICRRRILALVFKNKLPTVPASTCCDICNSHLFDNVRPSKPVKAARQKGIRRGPASNFVRLTLFSWRCNIKKMHHPGSIFAPHAILDDATCELLTSIGPVETIETLKQLLESSWSLWDQYGARLFTYMHNLDIPALPPPPARKSRAAVPPPSVAQEAVPTSGLGSTTAVPALSLRTPTLCTPTLPCPPKHGRDTSHDLGPSQHRPPASQRRRTTAHIPQTPQPVLPVTPRLPLPLCPVPTPRFRQPAQSSATAPAATPTLQSRASASYSTPYYPSYAGYYPSSPYPMYSPSMYSSMYSSPSPYYYQQPLVQPLPPPSPLPTLLPGNPYTAEPVDVNSAAPYQS